MTRTGNSFLELLKIDVEENPVIAVVGGGGKTSLIFQLTRELVEKGKKVIITTTTHMAYDPERPFAGNVDPDGIQRRLDRYGYVIAAERQGEAEKVSALPLKEMEALTGLCDVLLIEADGARQHPLKVPEDWEPVIPPFADLVVSVVGLDCLGKPIRETAHRMERTAEFLKKSMDAPVTPEDVVKIASSICGLFKDVEDRVYRVYLNKADTLPEKEPAEIILKELLEKNTVAAYGSLKEASEP